MHTDEDLELDRMLSDGSTEDSYLDSPLWTPNTGDSVLVEFKTPVNIVRVRVKGGENGNKVTAFTIYYRRPGAENMEPLKENGVQVCFGDMIACRLHMMSSPFSFSFVSFLSAASVFLFRLLFPVFSSFPLVSPAFLSPNQGSRTR